MTRREEIREFRLSSAVDLGRVWEREAPRVDAAVRRVMTRGPSGADSPGRVRRFLERERSRTVGSVDPGDPAFLGIERRFGPTLDYEYRPPEFVAQTVGTSVARLVESQADGVASFGFATGFLISPRLLITNWHVFPSASRAEGTAAQFGYEYRGVLLQEGDEFALRPEQYFYADKRLDFALVAVDATSRTGRSLGPFGFIRPIPVVGKILLGHSVHMIGYPEGQPKTYVSKNNPLVSLDDERLQYLTDSDEGASGSPAFNPMWELVALHHRAIPRTAGGRILRTDGTEWRRGESTEDIEWIANQGTRISVIVNHLRALRATKAADEHLDELLAGAVDTVAARNSRTPSTGAGAMARDESRTAGPIVMNFTGPVSINIHQTAESAPIAVAPPVVAVAPPGDEAVIRFDPRYDRRKGYQRDFLEGHEIDPPSTSEERSNELVTTDGGAERVLHYRHFSLSMNRVRRLQMWSAVNVSYADHHRKWFTNRNSFGTDKWIPDRRIAAELQLVDKEIYKPSPSLQRGHIVRRDDNAWGYTMADQEYANSDTFHWTNCTPQHGGFNESSYDIPDSHENYSGLWGSLENKIQALAKQSNGERLIIFAGPVLDADDAEYDWGYGAIQVPMRYWKIVVADEEDGLGAYGFVLDQTAAFDDLGFERLNFGHFDKYQVPLARIVADTGVEFDEIVMEADVMQGEPEVEVEEGDEIRRPWK